MLPPVDPALLSANPKFDALYRDLCKTKLHQDGSTVLDQKAQKERIAFAEELRVARIAAAKRQIIRAGLHEISYRANALPEELQELVIGLTALLEGQISSEDRDIMQDDLDRFSENVTSIAAALSRQLKIELALISKVMSEDPPQHTNNKAKDPPLPTIAALRSLLADTRLHLAQDAAKLHSVYSQVLETCIRILEQTMHGSVSRATKAKADYLAVVAEGMAKKLSLQQGQLTSQLYSTEIQKALKQKSAELAQETRLLRRKIAEAEEKLESYQAANGIQGMAKEYAEILKESDKVRDEISRLEQRRS